MTVDQSEIHRNALSSEVEERRNAVRRLSSNFADLPDKEKAWKDLIRMTQDEKSDVRWGVADASEVNSKTLEFLKYKLLDLTASGKEIDRQDVGCGDGRCLKVLDAVQNIGNVRYHGTDRSYRYLDDTGKRARKYKLNARLDKIDAAAMKFDSKYDVVSAVLLLHEVDPLCLPYILRNMLQALKGDGTLIIADFQGPYEQEAGVVAWGAEDIRNLLKKSAEQR